MNACSGRLKPNLSRTYHNFLLEVTTYALWIEPGKHDTREALKYQIVERLALVAISRMEIVQNTHIT